MGFLAMFVILHGFFVFLAGILMIPGWILTVLDRIVVFRGVLVMLLVLDRILTCFGRFS